MEKEALNHPSGTSVGARQGDQFSKGKDGLTKMEEKRGAFV